MSKAVLLSVRPNWCKLIWAGMKTVEVRKTCPKLETPFKVYIYCSGNSGWLMRSPKGLRKMDRKVIGEFVCDEVYKVDRDSVGFNFTAPSLDCRFTPCQKITMSTEMSSERNLLLA